MKPISTKELPDFLDRFENFKDAELRSLEVLSPTEIEIIFATQDKARAYDWITIEILFSGVTEAKLIDVNKLSFIDMSDGVSIIKNDNIFAFGIGECYNIQTIETSVCYILSASIKYQEGQF